jgi:hypothetical protein
MAGVRSAPVSHILFILSEKSSPCTEAEAMTFGQDEQDAEPRSLLLHWLLAGAAL